MSKPIIVERFADNGEHSHWDLVAENGNIIWSGGEPETPKAVTLEQVKDEVAKEKGFESGTVFTAWEKLFMCPQPLRGAIDEIATRYASAITEETNARHDKEMEEFAEWVGNNCKKGHASWEYFGDGPAYSTAELLALFRNRNK